MSATYKIGDLVKSLNITARTLRWYEEEGLISPARSDGKTRQYSERDIMRIRAVRQLADSGVSLEAVRTLVDARDENLTGDLSRKAVSAELDRQIEEAATKIEELEQLQTDLRAAKALVGTCKGCPNPPSSSGCPTCALVKAADRDALISLIWD